ncbi:MAG: RNA methyltransferase [Alcaligenaceae bacterium]|jgi:TrmH family RNA methyltransferase|nr:RNA methyltransferase [Alcaligenaceae bacterium]
MSFEAKLIDSKNNPTFKHFLKIANDREKKLCLLEGIHLCQEFLKNPRALKLQYAVFQSSALNKAVHTKTETANELKALYESFGSQTVILADGLFKQLCEVPSPQGVLLIVEVVESKLSEIALTESMVVLDRLQDPGNLGTIIRTTAAAGIEHLVLSKASVNPWSSKVLRSAQGAHFELNIYTDCDLIALIKRLQVPVYATALNERADSLYSSPLPRDCAWLLGNEGQGVSAELLAQATKHIFIPQSDKVESLNVAVACGVVLFEHRRQLLAQSA